MEIKPDFLDLRTRAELLDICGDKTGAERLRSLSLEVAREVDLTCYAYQLVWRNKVDDAIEILERTAAMHPESWNARHSLGEAYESLGDFYSAAMNFRMASALADAEHQDLIDAALARVLHLEVEAS